MPTRHGTNYLVGDNPMSPSSDVGINDEGGMDAQLGTPAFENLEQEKGERDLSSLTDKSSLQDKQDSSSLETKASPVRDVHGSTSPVQDAYGSTSPDRQDVSIRSIERPTQDASGSVRP